MAGSGHSPPLFLANPHESHALSPPTVLMCPCLLLLCLLLLCPCPAGCCVQVLRGDPGGPRPQGHPQGEKRGGWVGEGPAGACCGASMRCQASAALLLPAHTAGLPPLPAPAQPGTRTGSGSRSRAELPAQHLVAGSRVAQATAAHQGVDGSMTGCHRHMRSRGTLV